MEQPLHELLSWFRCRGGLLHPSISASFSASRGVHLRALADIDLVPNARTVLQSAPAINACEVPLSLTLSLLSIPSVAPHWPASFLEIHNANPFTLPRFLLVDAFLQAEGSEWWAYLRCVPQVGQFETPLWWEDEDLQWLKGTALEGATKGRESAWKEEWREGREILESLWRTGEEQLPKPAGRAERWWDGYSWELYKWAATVLTSRAFPQSVLKGLILDDKDGSAFSSSTIAKRWRSGDQTLEFPVLVPVLDLANHDPFARVTWQTDGQSLALLLHSAVKGDAELCNNYGQKSNQELIIGYGFCLDVNSADYVSLLISVSRGARGITDEHRGDSSKTAADSIHFAGDESGTRIYSPFPNETPYDIVHRALRSEDAISLSKAVANEREILHLHIFHPQNNGNVRHICKTRNFVALADKFLLGLQDRHARLKASAPAGEPKNSRQRMAVVHRTKQLQILGANIHLLDQYLCSLEEKGVILTLACLLDASDPAIPSEIRTPLVGLLAMLCSNSGTKPLRAKKVRALGLHELAYTLFVCCAWLLFRKPSANDHNCAQQIAEEGSPDAQAKSHIANWVAFLQKTYCPPPGWSESEEHTRHCWGLNCHLTQHWGLNGARRQDQTLAANTTGEGSSSSTNNEIAAQQKEEDDYSNAIAASYLEVLTACCNDINSPKTSAPSTSTSTSTSSSTSSEVPHERNIWADARWTQGFLRWGLNVWREECVVLESLGRVIVNSSSSSPSPSPEHEHEDMLFLESLSLNLSEGGETGGDEDGDGDGNGGGGKKTADD